MLNFLRGIRVLAGLFFLVALAAIVLQVSANLLRFDFFMPSSVAIIMLGLMHAAFWLWAFLGLRNIINNIHEKEHGTPHPGLTKRWHL
ncbi:hypothetical protein ACR0ST_04710 [Aliidiomarina sp. Khilg15.8]